MSDLRSIANEDTTLSAFCEKVEYGSSPIIYKFGNWTNAKIEAGIDVRALKCPSCNTFFSMLSSHWNSCGEPKLSEKQKSMLVGMFLSDATVSKDGTMKMYSSNKEFIDWLSDELSFVAYEPILNDTGEDRHKRNIKSGFDGNRDAEYKDMYCMSVVRHSFTESMIDWYDEGRNKFIPESLPVDENMMKIWYCGDGGLNWSKDKRAYSELRPINFDNSNVTKLVDKFGLEYSIQESGTVCFYGDTEKFLDKIGPAPKGMEYKWENSDRRRYNRLKP